MQTVNEIVDHIGVLEKAGFTRDQAIKVIQIEKLIIIGNRLDGILRLQQRTE